LSRSTKKFKLYMQKINKYDLKQKQSCCNACEITQIIIKVNVAT